MDYDSVSNHFNSDATIKSMTNSLKLARVNIHGIRNSTKRKTFFRYLKKGAFDIICIQESYITDADKEMWKREGGRSLFYTNVTGYSMGFVSVCCTMCFQK